MTEMKKPVRLGSPEYQAVYDSIIDIASNIKYASTFSNAGNIYENPL